MFISDFAIRRPVITVVTMLALVVFGIFSLAMLDTDEYPEVNPPFIGVAIPYPGASPDVVEREVVDPVEEAIAGISGVDEMQSTSLDGYASILVTFDYEKDVQQASQDIRDAISGIRGDLPLEMEEPIIARFDPNDFPIVSLTLSSEALTSAQLTQIADPGVTRALRGLSGVAEVRVVGGVEREMTVEVRPEAMQAAGIGIGDIVTALQAQNLAAPVGRVTGVLDERTIRLRGRLERPADFEQLVVTQRNGQIIRLGEVASVRDGAEEARSAAIYNGQAAVGIDIIKAQSYSTTEVSDRIQETVHELRPTLPPSVKLQTVRDAGPRVENSVENVQEALLEGALLTVLVVFLFLNSWRSTVITGLALPVSVLAAFIAVWAFGFTLNTMSLMGLSLAIGILIDDAIVVRENIVRHVEMGKDHYTAAREGTAEIGLAVAATTFSIVVVFVPMAFMGGIAEQWFGPFALTIACAVLVSLLVSFSLDPMLSAYWPDPHVSEDRKWRLTKILDRFNHWFNRQAENYKKVIAWALDHRLGMIALGLGFFVGALTIPVKGISSFLVVIGVTLAFVYVLDRYDPRAWRKAGLLLGAVVLTVVGLKVVPPLGVLGGEFFPADDQSELIVRVETPPGSNLEYTRLKSEEVGRMVRRLDEVAYTYTTIGGQSGAVDVADVYVRLVPQAERDRSQQEVAKQIRAETKRIGGATAWLVSNNFEGIKQIQIELRGPDIDELNRLAQVVEGEVREVPGAVDIGLSTKGQKPELEVTVDRGLAGSLGLSVGQVAQALRPAFAGLDAGDWIDPSGETRDVVVRLAPESRQRAVDLAQLPLTFMGNSGASVTVPLGQVAYIEQGLGPAQINHTDRERVIAVQANTEGRSLSEVVGDINARTAEIALPPGYRIVQGGETEDQQEVFGRILASLGIAVMLMYLILVVQFGSFLDPLAIMVSLPLSLIGVMLGLWLTGNTLNLMSMIGVILLFGIVAKNAILLIDFAKWAQERGADRRTAIIEAGSIRLRPILMTTFALIAGMIPIALGRGEGAQFRAPMGIAIIGGVMTSTLLTLLVIPTVYEILDELRESVTERVARRRGVHAEPAAVTGD